MNKRIKKKIQKRNAVSYPDIQKAKIAAYGNFTNGIIDALRDP